MNLLRRLLGKNDVHAEERQQDPSWSYLSAYSGTGSNVNAKLAESLSTVFACVAAISSSIASLPAVVYRWEGKARKEAENHPLSALIENGPNRWQSWPDFVEWWIAQTLLRGNGLAEIVTDGAGRVMELKPIPWEWCSVLLLPNGRLAYDVNEQTMLGGQGRTRRLLQGEVLHLKDRSDDGLVGRSRLSRTSKTIQSSFDVNETASAFLRNAMQPSGIFRVPGVENDFQLKSIRDQLVESKAGPSNTGKFFVLAEGVEWQSMSVNPEDAELLESRRFSTEELARIFQVPPPLVGIWDHSSFTNSETAGRWFATHTLTPWVRKIEAEFKRTVFTSFERRDHFLEIDLSGFLRGDPEQRWKAYDIALKNKVLDPNEVRQEEGWNPRAEEIEVPLDE